MTRKYFILVLLALVSILVTPASADSSVAPYGGVLSNNSYNASTAAINVYTNIPLTTEGIAYPPLLFYLFVAAGFISLMAGVWLVARSENVPSIAILMCGVFAFGAFAIAAFMAPYVASTAITQQMLDSTMYISSINTYIFSPWVSQACWGGAIAGFIEAVAGTLSFFGWFHRKGMNDAKRGAYIETDTGEVVNSRFAKNK